MAQRLTLTRFLQINLQKSKSAQVTLASELEHYLMVIACVQEPYETKMGKISPLPPNTVCFKAPGITRAAIITSANVTAWAVGEFTEPDIATRLWFTGDEHTPKLLICS